MSCDILRGGRGTAGREGENAAAATPTLVTFRRGAARIPHGLLFNNKTAFPSTLDCG